MSLLEQAIQEYLAEHHPEYKAVDSLGQQSIYVFRQRHQTEYIRIAIHNQIITAFPHDAQKEQMEKHYTETTLLSLITEAINYTSQP